LRLSMHPVSTSGTYTIGSVLSRSTAMR